MTVELAEKTLVPSALEITPRQEWHTSPVVSRALLNCPKVKHLTRLQIMRKGLSIDRYFDDALADVVAVMQINMMPKLEKIDDVYFVVYRVAEFVSMGLSRKDRSEIFGPVRSFSDLTSNYPEQQTEDVIDKMMDQSAHVDSTTGIEEQIDRDRAKKSLLTKLNSLGGWPEEIPRARKSVGRPRGSTKEKIQSAKDARAAQAAV